jgi:signal transduction histidine kinase
LGKSIAKDTQHLPSYFGVGVDVAGKRIFAGAQSLMDWHNEYVASGAKGAGQYWKREYSGKTSTNLLASASRLQDDAEQLKVSVFLTNPAELFATQKSRALWFGLLVIASTVAALVGLFMAARAFHRQLRLTEMKSNFVSSVSHELRAPIASVRLMAESLERGKVAGGEKQNEYYRFIVQECRRLSSLIENVLDFSRIEQGRKQYEFEPTDVAALTRQTVKLMEPYAQEKGVQLEMKTSNVEHRTLNIELEVDGRAIQQALVNLIDNAIKHSAKGQTVTIELDAGQRASGVPPDFGLNDATNGIMPVLLSVEDHGAGIPAAEHEKIFERFYRLGSELRRETQGVGIGLSIVRHIVEAHGGKVTVRSNPGQGSRFTIVLPVKNSETTDDHG